MSDEHQGACLRPCIFFDRDGIANVPPPPGGTGYILRPGDLRLLPGFTDAVRVARRFGCAAVVITNQRCVAGGLISEAGLADIHRRLEELLAADGVCLDGLYYCPHGDGECAGRKPQPGMLLHAARELGLDLRRSLMIGDQETDVQAGRAAGCRTVLVNPADGQSSANFRLAGVSELPGLLENVLRAAGEAEKGG